MNPCPCGYLGHHTIACRCGPGTVARYHARVSGPLLDRIDLHVHVPPLTEEQLAGARRGEASATVRERVMRARAVQIERQGESNARMPGGEVEERAQASPAARAVLRRASGSMALSARAHQRILRVARTVADLEGCVRVGETHIAEALTYRPPRIAASAPTAV